MDVLISINHVPIIRFPSFGEALTAMAAYLAKGHPVESILLTPWHDGEPTHQADIFSSYSCIYNKEQP
jgi:hypothetical protein